MQIDWPNIQTGRADTLNGTTVDISGWMIPLDPQADTVDYFLLSADEPCCGGCVPRNPLTSIEVQMAVPLAYRPAAHSNETPEDNINPSTTSLKTPGLIRTTINRAEKDPVMSAEPVIKPSITTCIGNAPK